MKYNREYAFKYTGPESIPQDWTLNEDYSFDGSNLICDDMCAVLGNLVGYNLDGDRPIDVLVIQCLDEYEKKEIITTEFQEILEDAEVADVATPVATPEAGEVESGTTVTLSCETEGAVIYYTIDGTDPTSASTEYTEAIEITEEITIKAIAIKEGLDNSKILSSTYTIAGPAVYTVSFVDGLTGEDRLGYFASSNLYEDPADLPEGVSSPLYELLVSLPINTVDTPYKLIITNTLGDGSCDYEGSDSYYPNVSTWLGYEGIENKYIDLSEMTLPSGITQIPGGFYSVDTLIISPTIPSTVTSLYETFSDCENLKTVTLEITDYTNVILNMIFTDCTSLENVYVPSADAKTSLLNKLANSDYPEGFDMNTIIKVIDSGNNNSGEIGTIK